MVDCGPTRYGATAGAGCGQRTCTGVDYVDRIYDWRRRNFWDYACPFQFASGNSTFAGCRLLAQPNELTRPHLRYKEPTSYADYLATLGDYPQVVTNVLATKKPLTNVLAPPKKKEITNVLSPLKKSDGLLREGCVGCSIVPNCGDRDGQFSFAACAECDDRCAPQPVFKRRMLYNGQTFKPPSSLPVLDRYQWVQPEAMYYFYSPSEYMQAYDAIYNGNLQPRAKFNFQNPKEQTRLWAGIPPASSGEKQQAASSNAGKRVDDTCRDVPVPYYRDYLDSQYNCGCNRSRCSCAMSK